jgi:hypothetical protein
MLNILLINYEHLMIERNGFNALFITITQRAVEELI